MARNCPECGALLTGETCLSCGYSVGEPRSDETARPEEPSPNPDVLSEAPPAAPPTGVPVWEGEPPPWERRDELGFVGALWSTWRDSVFRPIPFFRGLASGTKGASLSYFILIAAFGLFFRLYWMALESILGGLENFPVADLGLAATPEQEIALFLAGTFVTFIFLVFLSIGLLFVSAAIVHVGFAVVGAGRQGFDSTFRAVAYSAGPFVFWIFPFFGQILALIWGTVLLFIAVREVQRTTNMRATLGFLVPALAFMLLFMVALFVLALILSTADIGPII